MLRGHWDSIAILRPCLSSIPISFPSVSHRFPIGFLSVSFRFPFGFLSVSFRVPIVFLSDYLRILGGALANLWGISSGFLADFQRIFGGFSADFRVFHCNSLGFPIDYISGSCPSLIQQRQFPMVTFSSLCKWGVGFREIACLGFEDQFLAKDSFPVFSFLLRGFSQGIESGLLKWAD